MYSVLQSVQAGLYWLELLDYFVGGWSLILIGLCESMLIGWVYGAKRLMADIEDMVGFKLWKHWWFCWTFITPLLLIVSTRALVVLLDLHHATASHRTYTCTGGSSGSLHLYATLL